MRCLACDKRLNSRESTRKYASSGSFIDLCDRCFSYVSEEIPDVEDGISPNDFDEEDTGDILDHIDELHDFAEETGLSTFTGEDDNGQSQ